MTDIVTREEREDLRRLHKAFNEGVFGSSKAMAMTVVYTGACNRALPRLLDTIDALETENARLWERTRHSERLLICVCGMAPGDPGWKWAAGEGYENGHVVGGADPELCGPVGLTGRVREERPLGPSRVVHARVDGGVATGFRVADSQGS